MPFFSCGSCPWEQSLSKGVLDTAGGCPTLEELPGLASPRQGVAPGEAEQRLWGCPHDLAVWEQPGLGQENGLKPPRAITVSGPGLPERHLPSLDPTHGPKTQTLPSLPTNHPQ